jgi:hypothetical protein
MDFENFSRGEGVSDEPLDGFEWSNTTEQLTNVV